MDFGATWNGYGADITRTVVVGPPDEKQRRVYSAVVEAQDAVISEIAVGRKRQDAARAGMEVIKEYGYEEYAVHGAGGHSIGLEVHEEPTTSSDGEWVEGNIVTVEPGIYIPGWGGVRVEDDILVTAKGPESLTPITRELIEL